MFAYKPHSATSSPHPQQVPVESLVKGTRRASRQQIRRRRNRASLAANALNNHGSEKQGLGVALARNPVGNGLENLSMPGTGHRQKIHYLTGGDGSLFAMYVIDQNNQGEMYYIYTDHLGSPNLITDADCNVVQKLSFDACCVKLGFCEHSETKSLVEPIPSLRKGNKRNPVTWQPYIGTMPQALYTRGYTMHEHLANFGLIDMLSAAKSRGEAYAGKGRVGVYPERCNRFGNPLVGHFLSADPFIQAPEFSLSFNRYSYCLNNPLLYTDPTGFFAEGPDVDASGLSNNFDGSNDLGSANSGAETRCNTDRQTDPQWWVTKEGEVIGEDGTTDGVEYIVLENRDQAMIRTATEQGRTVEASKLKGLYLPVAAFALREKSIITWQIAEKDRSREYAHALGYDSDSHIITMGFMGSEYSYNKHMTTVRGSVDLNNPIINGDRDFTNSYNFEDYKAIVLLIHSHNLPPNFGKGGATLVTWPSDYTIPSFFPNTKMLNIFDINARQVILVSPNNRGKIIRIDKDVYFKEFSGKK